MKAIIKIIFVALLMATPNFVNHAHAAGMGMGMGTPCGGPFPPCPVPLDNSVLLLLLAGATFGAYKIYVSYKKNPA